MTYPRILLLTPLIALVASNGFPQSRSPETPSIVATGEATIRTAPDQAFATIVAESRAATPRAAQQTNAEAMATVHDRLKGARLGENAVRTLSYDVQPEFDFVNNKRVLRGYVARNAIEVRIDDVLRIGEILDLAIGAGATTVQNIRFDLKRRDQLEREALRQAVVDARARADAAAAGAGQAIAYILRIEEDRADRMPRPTMMMMSAEAREPRQTPIEPGQIEVTARVTLTAAIK